MIIPVNKWTIGIVGVLVLALGLACWYGAREHGKRDEYAAQAAEALGRAKALEVQAKNADAVALAEHVKAIAALAARDKALAKLAASPRPADPAPVPPTEAELTAGLAAKGILTPLPHIEAATVWTWSEEAIRVPALETRLAAAEAVIATDTGAISSLKGEAEAWQTAADKWRQTAGAQEARGNALDGQIKSMARQERAERLKWWAKVGGGVLVGYLAGRAAK